MKFRLRLVWSSCRYYVPAPRRRGGGKPAGRDDRAGRAALTRLSSDAARRRPCPEFTRQ